MKDKRRGQRGVGNGGEHYNDTHTSGNLNKDERFNASFFFGYDEARKGFTFSYGNAYTHGRTGRRFGEEKTPEPQRTRQPCPHSVLGVECGATLKDLRKAYRRLAKIHHPDLGSPEERKQRTQRMAHLNKAYSAATQGLQ